MTSPVLPPSDGPAAAVSGEVLPPVPASLYSPPQGGLDLAYRIWATLTWARTGQIVVLLLVVAAGAGLALHELAGTAGLWTALGGGATGAAGAHALRRRAARR